MGTTVNTGPCVSIILCAPLACTDLVVDQKRWTPQVSRESRMTKFVKRWILQPVLSLKWIKNGERGKCNWFSWVLSYNQEKTTNGFKNLRSFLLSNQPEVRGRRHFFQPRGLFYGNMVVLFWGFFAPLPSLKSMERSTQTLSSANWLDYFLI